MAPRNSQKGFVNFWQVYRHKSLVISKTYQIEMGDLNLKPDWGLIQAS